MDQLQSQHHHTFALKPVLSSQRTASGEYLFIRSFSDHSPNIYDGRRALSGRVAALHCVSPRFAGWSATTQYLGMCQHLEKGLLSKFWESPFFLAVSPMPWLSQAVLIFLVAPCQELLSSFTCTVDAPVVPSGSQGPGSLLLHGLFSRQQQKAPGRAEPHSATALLRLCNGFPAQSEYNLIFTAWLDHPYLMPSPAAPPFISWCSLPPHPSHTVFSFQTPGNLFPQIFTSPYFTWLRLWSSMTLSEVLLSFPHRVTILHRNSLYSSSMPNCLVNS